MLKQFTFSCLVFSLFGLPQQASAEINKSVDADGHVTYSNVKSKGAKKMDLEPADTNFGTGNKEGTKRNPAKTPTPASFPKVDTETQKQRDDSRKAVLQSELEAERKALDEARKAYAEGESNPEIFHKKNADGSTSTFRNMAKFQEKMKNLQADVDTHQRNVELLEKEISTVN